MCFGHEELGSTPRQWEISLIPHTNRATLCTLALAALTAYGGGEDGGTGAVSLSITDAPVDDVDSVVVQFHGVAFKRAGASAETVQNLTPAPRQLDLLEYQEGRAALLLDDVTLPPGEYEWIRLIIDTEAAVRDSYVTLETGEECELRVPSGAESGLKLNRGFSLPADGSAALTIDFDLRKSLHAPPGQQSATSACTQGYLLRPTLRVVDDANVGAIAGTVDSALIGVGRLPKVYVFAGTGLTPDDLEESNTAPDVDPVVVAGVNPDDGVTGYSYRAAFIPPDTYTVAFTCSDDSPTADDVLTFVGAQTITVQANLISTVDFVSP